MTHFRVEPPVLDFSLSTTELSHLLVLAQTWLLSLAVKIGNLQTSLVCGY